MGRTSRAVLTLAGNLGWRVSGSAAAGVKDGYWFSVYQAKPGSPMILSTAISGLKTLEYRNLAQCMLDKKETFSLLEIHNSGNSLELRVKGNGRPEDAAARTEMLIAELVREFTRLGVPSGCSFCDEEGFHAFYHVDGEIINVCPECAASISTRTKSADVLSDAPGSYCMGILGAVLGALLGSVIWLGVSQIGLYASIVGYFMAFLAYRGYKLFGGRKGSYMPWIVAASVFLGVLLAHIANTAIGIIKYMEMGFSVPMLNFSLILALRGFYDNEMFNVARIWLDLGLGLLFAFLGSYRMISAIRKETGKKGLSIEKLQ